MRMKLSLFRTSVVLSILAVLCMAVSAHATHIQYVDRDSNIGSSGLEITKGSTYSITFDLKHDSMDLWKLAVGSSNAHSINSDPSVTDANYLGTGSYDPAYALHYVYLRIDPNRVWGHYTYKYLTLEVNEYKISDWSNPIKLYDWCTTSGCGCGCGCSCSISDPYQIADKDYSVTIKLTNHSCKNITITNINIEGCFDAAPVPEPGTVFLFITGLAGLAWMKFFQSS